MTKILILVPIWGNVSEEWGYDLFDECDYSVKNLYQAKDWVKRYNKYADENLTVKVI